MYLLKYILIFVLFSPFMALNATNKKTILSYFETENKVVLPKKSSPKLINLFDNVPDASLPQYKNVTLSNYYKQEHSQQDINTTIEQKKELKITKALDFKKETKKNTEAETFKEAKSNDSNHYDKVTKMVKDAFHLIGSGYKFGSNSKSNTYDCSLFTQSVFQTIGMELPRSSIEQASVGKKVSKDNLVIGDLIFFKTYRKTPSHVGIYIGDNKMIHASTQKGVTVDDLDEPYYKKRYLFAKRPNFSTTKME